MNKLDATSYTHAFKAIFSKVKEKHPTFAVGTSLKGIIADWSDTQLNGLRGAIGEETVNKVVKGCQVVTKSVYKMQIRICFVLYLHVGPLPAFSEACQ